MPAQQSLEQAYQYCLRIARNHYENFPVASRLLPRRQRMPIAVIYAFSRQVDDFADEGEHSDEQRLQLLNACADGLQAELAGAASGDPILRACADIIHRHELPVGLFLDLIQAFRMDVTTKRYDDVEQLRYYCRHSANPVGRLLLHLGRQDSEQQLQWSDEICSALQLINFLQDLSQDYHELGRIYIPQADLQRFGVTETHFARQTSDQAMRALIQQQVQRARQWLRAGTPLGASLHGMLGFEVRMIIAGGNAVLDKLEQPREDLFSRPRLGRRDRLGLLLGALRKRTRISAAQQGDP